MFRHPFFKPSGLLSAILKNSFLFFYRVVLHAMDANPIEALAHRVGIGQFESFKKTNNV